MAIFSRGETASIEFSSFPVLLYGLSRAGIGTKQWGGLNRMLIQSGQVIVLKCPDANSSVQGKRSKHPEA